MRSHSDITEAEIKAVYDSTPSINLYVPWAEAKANKVFVTLLKNQVISHEEDAQMEKQPNPNRIFLAINNRVEPPAFIGHDLAEEKDQTKITLVAQQPEKKPRRSTITLHERQINQLKNALTLARNCLQCGGIGEEIKTEALQELATSQKVINSFYQPR
jgi:hypothetical protein